MADLTPELLLLLEMQKATAEFDVGMTELLCEELIVSRKIDDTGINSMSEEAITIGGKEIA